MHRLIRKIVIFVFPLFFLVGHLVRADSSLEEANLWSAPTPSNLYQSILYSEGAENGVKEVSLSWSSLRLYADSTEDGDNNEVYDYTNLNTSSRDTIEGTLLYNRIRVLTERDFLVTQPISTGLWGKITGFLNHMVKNTVTSMMTLGGTVLGYMGATLTDVTKALLNLGGYIVSQFTPIGIFNLGKVSIDKVSASSDSSWFEGVVDWLAGVVIGDTSNIVNSIVQIALIAWIVTAGVTILIGLMTGNLKKLTSSFREFFFRLTVPIIFLGFLPTWNNLINNIDKVKLEVSNSSTNGLQSLYVVDTTKLFVATNGSLSLMYPDTYTTLSTNGKDNLANFGTAPSDIQRINDMIQNRLGGDLDQELSDENMNVSIFNAILSGGGVVDVSQYIDGIETAVSKNVTIPASMALNKTITEESYNFIVPDVSDWRANMGADKSGRITTGRAYFIDNIVTKSDSKELSDANRKRRRLHSLSIGAVQSDGVTPRRIAYNSDNFRFVQVSPKRSWTYLYGIKSSNSYTTANLANYTMSGGDTITKDPTGKVGNNNDPSDDENTNVGLTADEAKEVLWRNAYEIAVFNKYAGMSEDDIYDKGGSFSNQSMAMLLQSTFSSTGIKYNGYYVNYSDADKGKVVTANNNVGYVRYTIPNSGTVDFLSKVNTLSFTYIATAILTIGVVIAVFKVSVIGFLKDEWQFFFRILTHSSVSAMFLFLITDFTIRMLFSFANFVEIICEQLVSRIATSVPLTLSWIPFAMGFILIGFACLLVIPMVKIDDKKMSIVELLLNLFLAFIQRIRQPLMKIDDVIYGKPQYQNSNNDIFLKPVTQGSGDTKLDLATGFALGAGTSYLSSRHSLLSEDDDNLPDNMPKPDKNKLGEKSKLSQRALNGLKKTLPVVNAMALASGLKPMTGVVRKATHYGHKFVTSGMGAKLGLQGKTAQLVAKHGAGVAYDLINSGNVRAPKTISERRRRNDFMKHFEEMKDIEDEANRVFLDKDNKSIKDSGSLETTEGDSLDKKDASVTSVQESDSSSTYVYTEKDRDEYLGTDSRYQELKQKVSPYEIGGSDIDKKVEMFKTKVKQHKQLAQKTIRKSFEQTLDNKVITRTHKNLSKVKKTAIPMVRFAKKVIKK